MVYEFSCLSLCHFDNHACPVGRLSHCGHLPVPESPDPPLGTLNQLQAGEGDEGQQGAGAGESEIELLMVALKLMKPTFRTKNKAIKCQVYMELP